MEHGRDVLGTRREADHVAVNGGLAGAPLQRCDRPERGEDLARAHPGRDLPGELRRRCLQGRPRSHVHRGVLADLEGGEVEAERLHLPAEVLQAAVGQALQAVRDEGVAQLVELQEQLARPSVASALRSRLLGKVRSRPAEALGDRPEPSPIGLVGEAGRHRPHRLGEVILVAREAAHERRRGRDARQGPRRQHRHQPGRNRLVAVKQVVGLDPERLHRGLGSHVGVTIAIAADPRAPGQERRNGGRSRSRATVVRGGRARRRTGPRDPLELADRVQGAVRRAVQVRCRGEDGGIEEHHRRADLVERRRPGVAQVGRAPEERDLLAESAADLRVIGRCQARVVQAVQQGVDPPQRDQHGPPPGLRRVRRQHG